MKKISIISLIASILILEINTDEIEPIKLVLIRNGESVWNKLNIFTGWTDVPLSEKGVKEKRYRG